MMKIINHLAVLFVLCCGAFALCAGCVSLVEKAGHVIDGSAFAEKKIAVYRAEDMEVKEVRNKVGEHSLIITLKQFPTIQLRTSTPDDSPSGQPNGSFHLTSLDYLGGNYHGWNEYRLDLSGSGTAQFGDNTLTLRVNEGVEPVGISSGRIRRYDTRLTGTEALTSLRNRNERITVIAEWMRSREDAPQGLDQEKFADYWKPILLPEAVSKRKRPQDWQQAGDEKVRAEDINWNAGYTERVFPEELRNVRNSGTLLRDWEEALPWIYNEYEWERMLSLLTRETTLQKK